MAQGEHTHDWHYGDIEVLWKFSRPHYSVKRFCKVCHKFENIEDE